MDYRVFALFRELEQDYGEEIWMWVYTSLKRWYFLAEHARPGCMAEIPAKTLREHAVHTADCVEAILRQHLQAQAIDYLAAHRETAALLEDLLVGMAAKIV